MTSYRVSVTVAGPGGNRIPVEDIAGVFDAVYEWLEMSGPDAYDDFSEAGGAVDLDNRAGTRIVVERAVEQREAR